VSLMQPYLSRSVGLLGTDEFRAENREGHIMDAVIAEAAKRPGLVAEGVKQGVGMAYDNANSYNVSRATSRLVTGVVLSPLGALAAVGDVTYGIEQGYQTLNSVIEYAVYGYE